MEPVFIKFRFLLINKLSGTPEEGFIVKVFSRDELIATSDPADSEGKTFVLVPVPDEYLPGIAFTVEWNNGRNVKKVYSTFNDPVLRVLPGEYDYQFDLDIRRIKGTVQIAEGFYVPGEDPVKLQNTRVTARIESPDVGVRDLDDTVTEVLQDGSYEVIVAGSDFLNDRKAEAVSLECWLETDRGTKVSLAVTNPLINPEYIVYFDIPVGQESFKYKSSFRQIRDMISGSIYSLHYSDPLSVSGDFGSPRDMAVEDMGNGFFLAVYLTEHQPGNAIYKLNAILVKDHGLESPELIASVTEEVGSVELQLMKDSDSEYTSMRRIFKVSGSRAAVCCHDGTVTKAVYLDIVNTENVLTLEFSNLANPFTIGDFLYAKSGFGNIYFWKDTVLMSRQLSDLSIPGINHTIQDQNMVRISEIQILNSDTVVAAYISISQEDPSQSLGRGCAVKFLQPQTVESNPLIFSEGSPVEFLNIVGIFDPDGTAHEVAIYRLDVFDDSKKINVRRAYIHYDLSLEFNYVEGVDFNDKSVPPVGIKDVQFCFVMGIPGRDSDTGETFSKVFIRTRKENRGIETEIWTDYLFDRSDLLVPEITTYSRNDVKEFDFGPEVQWRSSVGISGSRFMYMAVGLSSGLLQAKSCEYACFHDLRNVPYITATYGITEDEIQVFKKAEDIVHYNPALNLDCVYALVKNSSSKTLADFAIDMSRKDMRDIIYAARNEYIIDVSVEKVDKFIDDMNIIGSAMLDRDESHFAHQTVVIGGLPPAVRRKIFKTFVIYGGYQAAFAAKTPEFDPFDFLSEDLQKDLRNSADLTLITGNRFIVAANVFGFISDSVTDLGAIPFSGDNSWDEYVGTDYPEWEAIEALKDITEQERAILHKDAKAAYIRTIESNIEIYGRSDFLYEKIPHDMVPRIYLKGLGGTSVFASTGRRGNFFDCNKDVKITEFGQAFDLSENTVLTWAVYEAVGSSTTYTKIFSKNETVKGGGSKYYSTGSISVELKNGNKYLFYTGWAGSRTFLFSGSDASPGHPVDMGFGQSTNGFNTGFSGTPEETLENPAGFPRTYRQQIRFVDVPAESVIHSQLRPNEFDMYDDSIEMWLEAEGTPQEVKDYFNALVDRDDVIRSINSIQILARSTGSAILAVGAFAAGISPARLGTMDRSELISAVMGTVSEYNPGYFGSVENMTVTAGNVLDGTRGAPNSGIYRAVNNIELLYRSSEGPSLSTLFGSLDLFEVDHADSLLGPAAYLTDLLQFLKGNPAAYSWFKVRRPDIAGLFLNKTNAETPLPYIDIVNEVLEYAIDETDGQLLLKPWDIRQTITDAATQKVSPQYMIDSVYDKLKEEDESLYPCSFDLKYERLLALLKHIEQSVSDMPGFSSGNEIAAQRYFGINSRDYDLMVNDLPEDERFLPPGVTKNLIGAVNSGSMIHSIGKTVLYLKDLLKWADIDLDRFYQFLDSGLLGTAITFPDMTPDFDEITVTGITWSMFKNIRRIDVFCRKSGFSVEQVGLIEKLYENESMSPSDKFLKISQLKRMMAQYDITLEEFVLLDGITLNKELPLYKSFFDNVTIKIINSGTLDSQKHLLMRALSLNEDEINLLIGKEFSPGDLADVENLSRLLRLVLEIRKRYGVSIADYYKIGSKYGIRLMKDFGFSAEEDSYLETNEETTVVTLKEQFDLSVDLGLKLVETLRNMFPHTMTLAELNNFSVASMEDLITKLGDDRTEFQTYTDEEKESFLKDHPVTDDIFMTLVESLHDMYRFLLKDEEDIDILSSAYSFDSGLMRNILNPDIQYRKISDILKPLLAFTGETLRSELEKPESTAAESVLAFRKFLIIVHKSAFFMSKLSLTDIDSIRYVVKDCKFGDFDATVIDSSQIRFSIDIALFTKDYLDSITLFWEKWNEYDSTEKITALSLATGWKEDDILIGDPVFELIDGTWPYFKNFLVIGKYIDYKRKTGLSYNTIEIILNNPTYHLTDPVLTDAEYSLIEKEILSKYDGPAQFTVQAAVNNILREKKRNALVSYLLTRSFSVSVSSTISFTVRFEDVRALYSFYLLDPEMNADTMTSRTVLSISAVQLFIQRLLMGIETYPVLVGSEVQWRSFSHTTFEGRKDKDGKVVEETDYSDFAREWEWRKNYRVWEANRKVFLYPENWIEPELRLDKTDFFKEFENELSQNALTDDHIEKTVSSFVAKLKNVSDLKIVATTMFNGERFIFGRTKNKPYKYYWTKRNSYMRWEGWHTLSINPPNGYFVPIVRANRLFLIWSSFEEQYFSFKAQSFVKSSSDKKYGDLIDTGVLYHDIYINAVSYSYGTWSEEKVVGGSFSTLDLALNIWAGMISNMSMSLVNFESIDIKKIISKKVAKIQVNAISDKDFEAYLEKTAEEVKKKLTNYRGYCLQMISGKTEEAVCVFDLYLYSYKNNKKFQMVCNAEIDFSRSTAVFKPYLYMDYTAPSGQLIKVNEQQRFFSVTPANPMNVIGKSYSVILSPDDPAAIFEDSVNTVLFELMPLGDETAAVGVETAPAKLAVCLTSLDHKTIDQISSFLYSEGIKGLYSRRFNDIEFSSYNLPDFLASFPNVIKTPFPAVVSGTDYRLISFFGLYNWELFMYIPMLIAKRLADDQQFEKAQRWIRNVFDPGRGSEDGISKEYWRFTPFNQFEKFEAGLIGVTNSRHLTVYDMLQLIHDEKAGMPAVTDNMEMIHSYLVNTVRMWEDNPFEPHMLGQLLIKPYMRNVAITYINNLISWGDMLFRQDTIESINEATQLYAVAADLLGRKPVLLRQGGRTDRTYAQLETLGLDELSNASTGSVVWKWTKDALQADQRIIGDEMIKS